MAPSERLGSDVMHQVEVEWRRAYAAIDAACAALAAVPGAGDHYDRLCALAAAFQRNGAAEVAAAHRAASATA